jgi:hypothetical protein
MFDLDDPLMGMFPTIVRKYDLEISKSHLLSEKLDVEYKLQAEITSYRGKAQIVLNKASEEENKKRKIIENNIIELRKQLASINKKIIYEKAVQYADLKIQEILNKELGPNNLIANKTNNKFSDGTVKTIGDIAFIEGFDEGFSLLSKKYKLDNLEPKKYRKF